MGANVFGAIVIAAWLGGGVSSSSATPQTTVEDVIQMSEAGVSDATILYFLRSHGDCFRLSAHDLVRMAQAGLSNFLIDQLVNYLSGCEQAALPVSAYPAPVPRANPARFYSSFYYDPWFYPSFFYLDHHPHRLFLHDPFPHHLTRFDFAHDRILSHHVRGRAVPVAFGQGPTGRHGGNFGLHDVIGARVAAVHTGNAHARLVSHEEAAHLSVGRSGKHAVAGSSRGGQRGHSGGSHGGGHHGGGHGSGHR